LSLNGALYIGRSALTASQAALQVVGNNMANAATPSYSRQRANLAPTQYNPVVPGVYTGTGVAVTGITRLVDDALNSRIRSAVSDSASNQVQQQAMDRVEATLNELTNTDLSSQMNAFFEAWAQLQTQPDNSTTRNNVILAGQSLTNSIQQNRGELSSIQEDLDTQVRYQAEEADALIQQIADLNRQVVTAETGVAGSAAALRDQRDDLLKQLSGLINISTREMEGGAVNVYIGNDPVIQYTDARHISYQESVDADGNTTAQIIFTDNNQAVSLTGGKIHGLITARDEQVGGVIRDLDAWTSKFIQEINTLHSTGRGLAGFQQVTGEYAVEDPNASLADLDDTGLKYQTTNGVFRIHVTDADGATVSTDIKVTIGMGGADTTLNDLVAALNAVGNISARVNGANQLEITADSGFSFGFSAPNPDDLSNFTNVLAALGVNTFFSGYNADTIDINSGLNVSNLAASADGARGNGDVAGKIAELATAQLPSLSGVSLTDAYSSMIGRIGADTKAAHDNYTASDVVLQTLESERQGISGVSVDEEAVSMITYQRAFQGAARFIDVINQLLDEVLALTG
jgi:flagellar hook-associated protein 1